MSQKEQSLNSDVVRAGILAVSRAFTALIGFGARDCRVIPHGFSLPTLRHKVVEISLARFAHILETLNRSGIKIIRSLEITEQTIENRVISKDIAIAREKVIEGISLAESLSGSKHFPKSMIMMLAVGEESGALDSMLVNISEQYDTSVDMRIEGLSDAIEPMLTIGIGGFLLVFALAIFLPMWRIIDVVK